MHKRTFFSRSVYSTSRVFSRVFGKMFFRLRWQGGENFPTTGGGLVCCNHQSYFDPILVGLTCDREMNYLARKSLFKFGPFRWWIGLFNAIPIDRDGVGLGGLKETLRRLRKDELVVIYPEGTRTRDGELQELKPGFCAVARRGKQPIFPMALDGAYDAWPRDKRLPRLSRIGICVGEPITVEQMAELSDDELVRLVSDAIAACFEQARGLRA